MSELRSAVARARHDPDCATCTDPARFQHVPNTVRVPSCGAHMDHCVLADMHAYSEWLATECFGREMVSAPQPMAEVCSTQLQGMNTAEVALIGRTTRRPAVMLACRDELERRWLASPMRDMLMGAVLYEGAAQDLAGP